MIMLFRLPYRRAACTHYLTLCLQNDTVDTHSYISVAHGCRGPSASYSFYQIIQCFTVHMTSNTQLDGGIYVWSSHTLCVSESKTFFKIENGEKMFSKNRV